MKKKLSILFLILMSVVSYSKVFKVGTVSDNPKKTIEGTHLMAEYLATELKDQGYTKGRAVIYPTLEEMVKAVKTQKVDLITETGLGAAILMEDGGAIPILRKWKKGEKEYHSIIFTKKDNKINKISDLVGEKVAFEERDSFSGYFIPRMNIEEKGLKLKEISSLKAETHKSLINYVFSESERNITRWVMSDLVKAGALNSGDWNTLEKEDRDSLKILSKSRSFPRAIELVSPHINKEKRERIKEILLNMNIKENKDLLFKYQKTTKFEKLHKDDLKLLKEINKKNSEWENN